MKKDTIIPKQIESASLFTNNFLDHDGNILDVSKYKGMLVFGHSMDHKNIHHNDLVLIEKISIFEYSNLELPANCIFYRGVKYADMPNNDTNFIICDALVKTNIFENDISKIAKDILESENFQKYRNDPRYVSDDFVKSNLTIPENVSNITIYPHLNYDNKWQLECIDSLQIYGLIKYSYALKN